MTGTRYRLMDNKTTMWFVGYSEGEGIWEVGKVKSFTSLVKLGTMLALLPECDVEGRYVVYKETEEGWVLNRKRKKVKQEGSSDWSQLWSQLASS